MSKLRLSILAFGPIVIVAVCFALCERLRSDSTGPASPNHVLTSQALAGELPAAPAAARN